jgi:hypothetical protein
MSKSESKLAALVEKLNDADRTIQALEKQLNAHKARRHMLATVDLPEAMAEFGSSIWQDGRYECKVDFKVYGSLPKEEELRGEAIDYLKAIGEEPLIIADLRAEFVRGNLREAKRMGRIIEAKAEGLKDLKVEQGVNHMTLAAMARARIKANKPLNMEVLGLKGLTIAQVKEKVK